MIKLQMGCMQRHSVNSLLLRLSRMMFAVADHGMSNRRELHPDLVLQTCYQRHAHQSSTPQRLFDNVMEFGPGSIPVVGPAQLLKHSGFSQVVHQSAFAGGQMAANNCHVFSFRNVRKELPYQCIPVSLSFGKQHDPGGEPVNAMNSECLLLLCFQLR